VAAAVIVAALVSAGLAAPRQLYTCPVTIPNGSTPPGELPSADHHGNGAIWVGLWPDGVLDPEPEWEQPDGSISMKFMWWRGVEGRLTITGVRLDGPAPPLRSRVPNGYGTIGFQASGIFFPTPGCWEVTGTVGTASLRFVLLVLPVTEEDRTGESSCTSAQVWMALWEFAKAFNSGNLRRLDMLFARPPVFRWYSSPAPGARMGAAAYRRGTLIRSRGATRSAIGFCSPNSVTTATRMVSATSTSTSFEAQRTIGVASLSTRSARERSRAPHGHALLLCSASAAPG